jgi:putative oxidoreductase
MKIAALLSRLLLGLVFVVFGLNGFVPFIPVKQMPTGLALQFLTALMQSRYVLVVSGTQLLAGILLLANRYVPLAVVLLGPVIVNILCYHIFLSITGMPIAALVAILWLILFFYYRQYFSGLWVQKAT